jgi:outer membrane receptor for ferrienterochelin and colicins
MSRLSGFNFGAGIAAPQKMEEKGMPSLFGRLGLFTMIAAAGLLSASGSLAQEAPADTLDATRMQETVVTGTRSEKILAETPVRTELVTRDDIKVLQAASFADACEFTPGLRILNSCQNCNFTTLSILGLDGQYSQVLYEGQPMFSGLSLVYGLEQIPSRLIERIEVIKGGGSSLYGPGAVGGVLNIIPHDPVESTASVSYRLEDMDGVTSYTAGFNADVVSQDGLTAATIFGQGNQVDPYDRDGDGYTEIAQRESSAMGARILRELDRDGRITVDYSRTFEDRRGGDQLEQPPFRSNVTEWIRTWRNALNASWRQPWSDTFASQISLAYAKTDRNTYYGGGGDENAYGATDNPLYLAEAQFSYYAGAHAITWGLQHTTDGLEDVQPAYDRIIDETYKNTGVYVQDDWQVNEPLVVVPGVRVDKHSVLDDAVVSPRLAARYEAAENVSVRGSISTGFLVPQVFDEDLHIAQSGGEAQVIRNIDGLKEESSRSLTLGVEATPPVGSGFGRMEVNVFRTDLEDAFTLTYDDDDPATAETEIFRINAGEATVQGVEATAGWMNDFFEFQLGWVFQNAEYDEPQDFDETEFFRTPKSYGVLQARYTNPSLFDAFLGVRFTGEEKVPHYAGFISEDRLETTPTFAVIDLSVTKSIDIGDDAVSLTLGGKNITDEFQDDVDQGPDRDTGYLYGPRFPRSWYFTLGYDF